MNPQRFPELIRDLYRIVGELEAMFPGRHFTPDGHMVGSIGECLAMHYYGVNLHGASHPCHDGICAGINVQIKTTQRGSVELLNEVDHLLVLRLDPMGGFEEVYNGPGRPAWDRIKGKKPQKNGYRQVSLSQLRLLMKDMPDHQRLPHAVPLPIAASADDARRRELP